MCALRSTNDALGLAPLGDSLMADLQRNGPCGGDIEFLFPCNSIGISMLGVFLVVFITTLYT